MEKTFIVISLEIEGLECVNNPIIRDIIAYPLSYKIGAGIYCHFPAFSRIGVYDLCCCFRTGNYLFYKLITPENSGAA